jgi:ABC-type uncharacterized transport system substrate-binding protein
MSQIQRRRFLVVTGVLLAAPLLSFAQPAQKVHRIGFISPDAFASGIGEEARKMFPASLRRLGYEEGKNLFIEWRWGDGKVENLRALAEDLVRLRVDIIVARTNGPIAAAKEASRTMPIVMLNGNFPVEAGFVASLARPGGNVTGTSYYSGELQGKQLQMLKQVAPSTKRLAVLRDLNFAKGFAKLSGELVDAFERAAASLGMTIEYFEVSRPEEVPSALDRIAASAADALWYSGAPVLRQRMGEIAALRSSENLHPLGQYRPLPTLGDFSLTRPMSKASMIGPPVTSIES